MRCASPMVKRNGTRLVPLPHRAYLALAHLPRPKAPSLPVIRAVSLPPIVTKMAAACGADTLSRTAMSTSVSTLTDIDADPVIDRGRVFALGKGGRMASYELVSGQRIWEINIAGISTPVAVGEWVFVMTDEAKLALRRPVERQDPLDFLAAALRQ